MKKMAYLIFGIAMAGTVIATSVSAVSLRRGVWTSIIELKYTDASPVTKKMKAAVSDIEVQIRRLGQVPDARPPLEKEFVYTQKECVPQAQGLGWVDSMAIFSTLNWACNVTRRYDGVSSVEFDFVCPDDAAKGRLTLNFPTDSTVVGSFERTDMSGATVFETAKITGALSNGGAECTP
jgi:hypothetical protein